MKAGCCTLKLSTWGWIFSSSWFRQKLLGAATTGMHEIPCGLFSLLFPDECRVCARPLREVTRIPVCGACLREPKPPEAAIFCSCCRTPFVSEHSLDFTGRCGLCRRGLRGFDAAYSFGAYEGTLRKLIHLFKYGRIETLAGPLGQMLAAALPREQRFDAVAPMPLHWRRRWQRGFNQADLLARAAGRRYGIPVRRLLRRTRATAPQAGLTNAGRRTNVAGAFAVKNEPLVVGRRILLIDDVMTTGATLTACALALKKAGAAHVSVLTLARADRRVPPAFEAEGSLQDVESGSIT